MRIRDATQQSLRFDFRPSDAIPRPWASAALQFDGADGKPGTADLSAYPTVTFLAKCTPANSLILGASQYSPRDVDSHVEIGDLALHGRDDRYLVALAMILVIGWSAFGIGFFRAQSRALGAR